MAETETKDQRRERLRAERAPSPPDEIRNLRRAANPEVEAAPEPPGGGVADARVLEERGSEPDPPAADLIAVPLGELDNWQLLERYRIVGQHLDVTDAHLRGLDQQRELLMRERAETIARAIELCRAMKSDPAGVLRSRRVPWTGRTRRPRKEAGAD